MAFDRPPRPVRTLYPEAGESTPCRSTSRPRPRRRRCPADPDAKQELKLQQSLFQWFGWSLAVEPPGHADRQGRRRRSQAIRARRRSRSRSTSLRPGANRCRDCASASEYGVRMRAVDIAGGRGAVRRGRRTTRIRCSSPGDVLALGGDSVAGLRPRLPRTEGGGRRARGDPQRLRRPDRAARRQRAPHRAPKGGRARRRSSTGSSTTRPARCPRSTSARLHVHRHREAKTVLDAPAPSSIPTSRRTSMLPARPEDFSCRTCPTRSSSPRPSATCRARTGASAPYASIPRRAEWSGRPAAVPHRLTQSRRATAPAGRRRRSSPRGDRVLTVELPKAQVVTLRVSSTPDRGELTRRLGSGVAAAAVPPGTSRRSGRRCSGARTG